MCVCLCVWDLESRQRINLGVVKLDGLEGSIVTVLNNSHPCAWEHNILMLIAIWWLYLLCRLNLNSYEKHINVYEQKLVYLSLSWGRWPWIPVCWWCWWQSSSPVWSWSDPQTLNCQSQTQCPRLHTVSHSLQTKKQILRICLSEHVQNVNCNKR